MTPNTVELPREERKDIKTFDPQEIKRLLKIVKETRYYAAYVLDFATGLRREELLALRWQDVDLESNVISVRQGLVRTKAGLVFQGVKTKKSKRSIKIPDNVAKVLERHKWFQNQEQLLLGEVYQKNNLVFPTVDGKPTDPRNFVRQFDVYLKKAGIPKIKFHSVRHTFATLSLQEGVDIKTTQENLGHHNAAFTLDIYSSVTEKMKKVATDKIGNLLASCLEE